MPPLFLSQEKEASDLTPTTKEIFENYEIRKSRKQKTAFLDWLRPVVEQAGYPMKIEKGSLGARNVVIGDPQKAKVVFAAHYDTCVALPFPNFITPKCAALYFLYQFALVAVILAVVLGAMALAVWLAAEFAFAVCYVVYFGILGLLFFGPANKHTANDNTSGVTAVIDLMNAMPQELKEDAAFVLFDLEEAGLIGSGSFAAKHKKAMKEKLLVNMDCVSDGETMLFVFRKKSKAMVEKFRAAFPSDGRVESDFATKGYVYPSDQSNFRCGVGISAMNKTKGGMLYMDKIHTKRDTVYREENIQYLVEGCIRLTESL